MEPADNEPAPVAQHTAHIPDWAPQTVRTIEASTSQPPPLTPKTREKSSISGVESYVWNTETCGGVAAPQHAFKQSLDIPANEFLIGQKVEFTPEDYPSFKHLATVMHKAGPRLQIRLDGCDSSNDIFELVDSNLIRPVGGIENDKKLYGAPMRYQKEPSNYHDFVKRSLKNASCASSSTFKPPPANICKNLFEVGMKLEAVDWKHRSNICPATITETYKDDEEKRDLVKIHLDGWEESNDYTTNYYSRDLFPVGWCERANHFLQAPGPKAFVNTSSSKKEKVTASSSSTSAASSLTSTTPASILTTSSSTSTTSSLTSTTSSLTSATSSSTSVTSSLTSVTSSLTSVTSSLTSVTSSSTSVTLSSTSVVLSSVSAASSALASIARSSSQGLASRPTANSTPTTSKTFANGSRTPDIRVLFNGNGKPQSRSNSSMPPPSTNSSIVSASSFTRPLLVTLVGSNATINLATTATPTTPATNSVVGSKSSMLVSVKSRESIKVFRSNSDANSNGSKERVLVRQTQSPISVPPLIPPTGVLATKTPLVNGQASTSASGEAQMAPEKLDVRVIRSLNGIESNGPNEAVPGEKRPPESISSPSKKISFVSKEEKAGEEIQLISVMPRPHPRFIPSSYRDEKIWPPRSVFKRWSVDDVCEFLNLRYPMASELMTKFCRENQLDGDTLLLLDVNSSFFKSIKKWAIPLGVSLKFESLINKINNESS